MKLFRNISKFAIILIAYYIFPVLLMKYVVGSESQQIIYLYPFLIIILYNLIAICRLMDKLLENKGVDEPSISVTLSQIIMDILIAVASIFAYQEFMTYRYDLAIVGVTIDLIAVACQMCIIRVSIISAKYGNMEVQEMIDHL